MTGPQFPGPCHRIGSLPAISKRGRIAAIFAVAAAIARLGGNYAFAADIYAGPSGDWNTGSNWSTGQPPSSGDATLNGNAGSVVVSMDATSATGQSHVPFGGGEFGAC